MMERMHRCARCDGFVPPDAQACPNCRSSKGSWWRAPLALAGAGLATVTLSACYGPGCISYVTRLDGTRQRTRTCAGDYNCASLPDGGVPVHDETWHMLCD
jgi:hypothetical protein